MQNETFTHSGRNVNSRLGRPCVTLAAIWFMAFLIGADRAKGFQALAAPDCVDIHYATDRKPVSVPEGKFGRNRGDGSLSFGRAEICVPPNHKPGQRFRVRPLRPCSTDPEGALIVPCNRGENEEDFYQSLTTELQRARRQEVLIFVHGYNFRFDEAVTWAAQLKHDLGFEGVLVLYSWPSHGRRLWYFADEKSVKWSTPHLEDFLERIAEHNPGTRIHLIAHSMGNQAVVWALSEIAAREPPVNSVRFGQVILAAADVDATEFAELAPDILELEDRITLYVCAKDRGLRMSARLHGGHPRAGDSSHGAVLVSDVDTVDVTHGDHSSSHHTYIFNNTNVLADELKILNGDAAQTFDRSVLLELGQKP